MGKKVIVKNESQVPTEVLADSIVRIAEGMNKILKSKLSERALLVLLKDSSGVHMSDIKKVLTGLEQLKNDFVRG